MASDDFRYRLWYAPEYPIEGLDWRRDPRDKALAAFVDTMERHMARFGVQNPICVHIRHDRTEVRPGKCRVTAAQRLGWKVLPAIVADYTLTDCTDWRELPRDAAEIQTFLTRDCVAEVSRRFFSIKKRDTVHRPGVENEFDRELREQGPNSASQD